MEVTQGQEATALLGKILPPRLEDAGLEDCALPPDSIHEAFLKAASAVKSRAASLFHSDDDEEAEDGPGCLNDPFPDEGKCSTDILASPPSLEGSDVVVVEGSPDPVGGCVKEKGAGSEVVEGQDTVVVGGDIGEAVDGKGCITDGLKGLKIGKKDKKKIEDEDEEDKEKERPILVEDLV